MDNFFSSLSVAFEDFAVMAGTEFTPEELSRIRTGAGSQPRTLSSWVKLALVLLGPERAIKVKRLFIQGGGQVVGGVTSLNTLTGALSLAGAGGLTITRSGQTLILTAPSSVGGGLTPPYYLSAQGAYAKQVVGPLDLPDLRQSATPLTLNNGEAYLYGGGAEVGAGATGLRLSSAHNPAFTVGGYGLVFRVTPTTPLTLTGVTDPTLNGLAAASGSGNDTPHQDELSFVVWNNSSRSGPPLAFVNATVTPSGSSLEFSPPLVLNAGTTYRMGWYSNNSNREFVTDNGDEVFYSSLSLDGVAGNTYTNLDSYGVPNYAYDTNRSGTYGFVNPSWDLVAASTAPPEWRYKIGGNEYRAPFMALGTTMGSSLTVREVDGTPSAVVAILEFPNGSVTMSGTGENAKASIALGTDPTLSARVSALETRDGDAPPAIGLAASSSTVTSPATVTLTAAATDDVSIVKVEFYKESSLIGTVLSGPYTYAANVVSGDGPLCGFTARAYDSAGQIRYSNTVTVGVNLSSGSTGTTLGGLTFANPLEWSAVAYPVNTCVARNGELWGRADAVDAGGAAPETVSSGWTRLVARGSAGTPGVGGSTLRNGSSAPSNALGLDGDYYLHSSTGDLYLRSGGTYAVTANLKGAGGLPGADGFKGWSPVLAVVADGERRVLQVLDWTGGAGTKPAAGQFVGPSGLVTTAAAAQDVRGSVGPAGAGSSINVSNADGTVTGAVTTIKLANGTVSISSGAATFTPAGGGGGTGTEYSPTNPVPLRAGYGTPYTTLLRGGGGNRTLFGAPTYADLTPTSVMPLGGITDSNQTPNLVLEARVYRVSDGALLTSSGPVTSSTGTYTAQFPDTILLQVNVNYYVGWHILTGASLNTFRVAVTFDGFVVGAGIYYGNPPDQSYPGYYTTFNLLIGTTTAKGVQGKLEQSDISFAGGTTADRPSSPALYQPYFDSTLNKNITWNGVAWKDAMGATV